MGSGAPRKPCNGKKIVEFVISMLKNPRKQTFRKKNFTIGGTTVGPHMSSSFKKTRTLRNVSCPKMRAVVNVLKIKLVGNTAYKKRKKLLVHPNIISIFELEDHNSFMLSGN